MQARWLGRLAAAGLLAACGGNDSGEWTPDPALIAEIERALPRQGELGGVRLDSYGRYYVGKTERRDGQLRRYVVGGALEPGAGGELGIHIGSAMPPVKAEDAGCAAIVIKYDVQAHRFVRATCATGW